jgi:hypothetical protein
MSRDKADFWRNIVNRIDAFLLPVSFGFLTVLVLAQLATTIPTVRRTVDRVEGRFVPYSSASAYTQQAEQSGSIQLYVSPDTKLSQTPPLRVLVDGRPVATLTGAKVTVRVHNGDHIELTATNLHQTAYITVDHNNPAILMPAPGQTVELSPTHLKATFPAVQFLN